MIEEDDERETCNHGNDPNKCSEICHNCLHQCWEHYTGDCECSQFYGEREAEDAQAAEMAEQYLSDPAIP